jgi:phosphopantothenoylcysteine decarboxylase/phosphopantothenate--cysteine ligase
MYAAVMGCISSATVFIGCAAVSDFRPAKRAAQKIKKHGRTRLVLELEATEDIIGAVGASPDRNGQIVAGFAAESESLLENARQKLREKGLDLIVANDITRRDAGFDAETNAATIIRRDGTQLELPLQSKRALADHLIDEILRLRPAETRP